MSDLDVKQIRADRGITQQELAGLMGVNLSTVWRWENVQPPRGAARSFLLKLAGDPSLLAPKREGAQA